VLQQHSTGWCVHSKLKMSFSCSSDGNSSLVPLVWWSCICRHCGDVIYTLLVLFLNQMLGLTSSNKILHRGPETDLTKLLAITCPLLPVVAFKYWRSVSLFSPKSDEPIKLPTLLKRHALCPFDKRHVLARPPGIIMDIDILCVLIDHKEDIVY
jgi:hypothetical protein